MKFEETLLMKVLTHPIHNIGVHNVFPNIQSRSTFKCLPQRLKGVPKVRSFISCYLSTLKYKIQKSIKFNQTLIFTHNKCQFNTGNIFLPSKVVKTVIWLLEHNPTFLNYLMQYNSRVSSNLV